MQYIIAPISHAPPVIDKYLLYIKTIKGYSPCTISTYKGFLNKFAFFFNKDLSELSLGDIMNFRLSLKGSLSHNSIEHCISALKSFLRWCNQNDIPTLDHSKVDIAKYHPVKINYLNRQNLERLFSVPDKHRLLTLRNQAMIKTLYSTGCRVSELISLNRGIEREIQIIGKGQKSRIVFMSEEAYKAVETYLAARKDSYTPLFITHGRGGHDKDRRLTIISVQQILRRYSKTLGFKATPHLVRHTFATELLRNGAPLYVIKEMLGHSSVTTTQRYLHVTDRDLKESFDKYHK